MRLPGFRSALVAAVAVAAVGVGLWSAHGSASAQAPTVSTITTELQPGWNMIGWMGSDTTTGEIFDAIPELRVVAAWDEDTERYIWSRRGGAVPPELEQLTRGRALFLWLSGTRAVEWSRPASAEGMLLSLPPGYSLVGWAGLDETPLSEAVGRFGDALVSASWWDAETQSYGRYEPGADEPAGGLPLLNHGDALWVELSEEARWWQSGTGRTRFELIGAVAQEQEPELRAEMARVVAVFTARYGIEPPPFFVLADPELDIHADASEGRIRLGGEAVDGPRREISLAHEYFHVLQFQLSKQAPSADGSPAWLTEGAATYAADVYQREREGWTDDRVRTAWWRRSLGVSAPLSALEGEQSFYALGNPGYWLGALAVDWLVRRAAALSDNVPFAPFDPGGLELREDHDAHVQYYRLRHSSGNWQAAFQAAFSIDVDTFYEEFAAYRAELTAARLPHLADDVDEPMVVFEGEIPSATKARIRMQFEDVQAVFLGRLGGGPVDYTMLAAADAASAAAAHFRLSGEELDESTCGLWRPEYSVVDLQCQTRLVTHLAWNHVTRVTDRLAPRESLPAAAGEVGAHGPAWLGAAMGRYAEAAVRAAVGLETLSQTRNRVIPFARHTGEALRNMETSAEFDALAPSAAHALGFLAAEWLAQRAGEPALFEYYRLLPASESWEAAFEGAFGITIEDFYVGFAAHRAEVARPLPHLADDVDLPLIVFEGDIPAEKKHRIRAEFEAVQALFDDRFAGEPVDYTVFVAADTESAAAAHLRVSGKELEEGSCSLWRPAYSVVDLQCQARLVTYLAWNQVTRVTDRLAPRDSPSVAVEEVSSRGPAWLRIGIARYAEAAARAVVGIETLGRTRSGGIASAGQTEQPLRSMETSAEFDAAGPYVAHALGFLAADWLVQRAEERSIFEYYRLLRSSDSWEEAFEGAFGITIDDFYDEFAKYRAAGFDA
ncbi:MAG: hypothetical protein OXG19_05300 [Chloroflexi bacterium]|nr:hypothetical protein [Chloroflexota bacterium]